MATIKQVRGEVLSVTLLGEFRLQFGETAVTDITTPSYQSLLAYLIFYRDKIHTRRQLAFQFWPDSSEAQARTNLRKAIFALRHKLPQAEQFLCLENQTIQWHPDAPFTLDVAEFEHSLNSGYQNEQGRSFPSFDTLSNGLPIANLKKAIHCYRGDLLPDQYDDWILIAREQLRRRYLSCLEQLILQLENERQYEDAIYYAQRLLREDSLNEAAYRRLMRLHALDGNIAGALRVYHTCATALQRELGVAPSDATQDAYERLLKLETPNQMPLPARVSLVAREQTWVALQTVWQQAISQRSQVVLLTGEAGIGKTRMAEELMDWTRRQGVTTLTAACYAAEGQLPYAPIADWLRNDKFQMLLGSIADKWRIECARLLPELLIQQPDLPPPAPLTEGWQRQHFFAALAQTILIAPQPILLFVDDLQWCDQDTLDWLHFLLRFDKQARFLLLGTVRIEELTSDHPLIPWQQFIQRDSCLTEIQLNRLDAQATDQLAEQITQHSLDSDQSAQLYAETEGIPLFVVETARAGLQLLESSDLNLAPNSLPNDAHLPPKVQTVIELRLSQLSPQARELTNVAAAIGRSFTFDLLLQTSDDEEELVVRTLDELWQRRIVREQGLDAYDFSHDKIRQVAYAGLGSARRRLLHSCIIKALMTLHADNLDKVSGQLAAHCEAALQLQDAVQFYQQAAKVSNRIFAHQETVQHLRRAIALLPKVTLLAKQKTEMYELLGDVLTLTGEYESARRMFETAVSHATDVIWQSQLYRKIANTWQTEQERDHAFEVFQLAEGILGEPTKTSNAAWWPEWLWIQLDRLWMLYLLNRDEEMAQLAEQIRPVLDDYGLPIQSGFYFQRLMLRGFHEERYVLSAETIHHAQVSLAAIEKSGHTSQIAFAHFALGMAYLWYGWHGNLDEAEYHMQIAQGEAEEIDDVVLQARCLTYLTLIYRRKREIDKVRDYLPRAMAVSKNANILEYVGQAQAHAAWLAWLEGNSEKTQKEGQAALENFKVLPMVLPFWGLAIWPLIGVHVIQNDIDLAVTYANLLLDPLQTRMPDELTAVLQQAIMAWENKHPHTAQSHLKQALQLAQTYNYL